MTEADVLRDLLKVRTDALRQIADLKVTLSATATDEEATDAYSGAVHRMKLIARQALPITE